MHLLLSRVVFKNPLFTTRSTKRSRRRKHGLRQYSVESLEDRCLLACLGGVDFPIITYDNLGTTSYNSSTDILTLDATPLTFLPSAMAMPPFNFVTAPKDLVINIEVDDAGTLVGGVSGDDFILTGGIDLDGDSFLDVSGTLLTGEVVQFGFQEAGSTDFFNFGFTTTGGALTMTGSLTGGGTFPAYFAGKDIAVFTTSASSTFTGSFTADFTGGALGNIGAVDSLGGVTIIDDHDSPFMQSGFTNYGIATFDQPQGYLGNIHYLQGSSPSGKATWTFSGLPAGQYRVAATWHPQSNRATDSPFKIYDGLDDGTPDVTTDINQQLAPDDFMDGGDSWEDVSRGATVSSGLLTVTLDNDITNPNQFVIADAIRVEQICEGPQIEVRDASMGIIDAAGTVDLGAVFEGSDTEQTISIQNVGVDPLDLGTITIGGDAQFSLDTGSLVSSLAPGDSTSFKVILNTAASGSFSATVSIPSIPPNEDPNENPFEFDVQATVSDTLIIDNRDPSPAFVQSGFTNYGIATFDQPQGYLGNIHYLQGSSPAGKATWTFTGLTAGTYQVSATWSVDSNRATDSPFKVYDGLDDGTPDVETHLNQQLAPDDFTASGASWEDVSGGVEVTGGTLTVTLENDISNSAKFVIADAIRIERRDDEGAEIEVRYEPTRILGDTGTVDLGTVFEGSVTEQTIAIQNVGATQLDLDTLSISGDAEFSLDTGSLDSSLDPGESTTFKVILNTAMAESFSATVSIPSIAPNDDANENPFEFIVQATVNDTLIIDNRDPAPGFVQSGFTNYGIATFDQPQGYRGNIHYLRGSSPPGKATWTFTGLTAGTYQVSATWFAQSNRATDSPFMIYDGLDDGTPDAALDLDQQLTPDDLSDDGVGWEDITAGISISSGTLTVTLDNAITDLTKFVIADGVRIERVSALYQATPSIGAAMAADLSAAQVARAFDLAAAAWESVDPLASERLAGVRVEVSDLPTGILGLASEHQNRIWLDADAGGLGWNVKPTTYWNDRFWPRSFQTGAGLPTRGIDLVTVIGHELGHVLGLPDLDPLFHPDDIMSGQLGSDVRRLPGEEGTGRFSLPPHSFQLNAVASDRLFTDANIFQLAHLTCEIDELSYGRGERLPLPVFSLDPNRVSDKDDHFIPATLIDEPNWIPFKERLGEEECADLLFAAWAEES